jgi:hypothetical protein
MALPVALDAVADELELVGDETRAYINSRTGELTTVSLEDCELAEDDELDLAELPAWQAKALPQVREVVAGGDWVPLPSKFDIHEWEIMNGYVDTIADAKLSAQLHRAIRGRGAFRTFRTTVQNAGLEEEWHRYRRAALREIARHHLESLGIAYK